MFPCLSGDGCFGVGARCGERNLVRRLGTEPGDRNPVTLALKFDGKALTGNVTGGENVSAPIAIKKGTYDPKTGVVHMEADTMDRRSGGTVHFMIDGKIDKNTMTGTWNHDNRMGDFKLTKK